MTVRLEGHGVAAEIEARLRERVARLPVRPALALLWFGEDPPSRVYGRMIARGCERVGIAFRALELPGDTAVAAACAAVEALNADSAVHGILVKRPLPGALADESLLQRLDPTKDVDGAHFENVGKLLIGGPGAAPVPCTPAGVLELVVRHGYAWSGRHVVVIGRSATVGKPLAGLLAQKTDGLNATVTLCHRGTRDLAAHTRAADIVVVAAGSPGFLRKEHVRPDAIVVDVGTNVVADPAAKNGYRLAGDADPELFSHCAALTPVPGGVGPVTVAMLLRNVVEAAERAQDRRGASDDRRGASDQRSGP